MPAYAVDVILQPSLNHFRIYFARTTDPICISGALIPITNNGNYMDHLFDTNVGRSINNAN
jgi:hypothetical protein